MQSKAAGTISDVKSLYPYRMRRIVINTNDFTLEVELPERLIEEANISIERGISVKVVLSEAKSNAVLESDVAYSGEVYAAREGEIYMSFGGILAKVSGNYPSWLKVGKKLYLGLSFEEKARL